MPIAFVFINRQAFSLTWSQVRLEFEFSDKRYIAEMLYLGKNILSDGTIQFTGNVVTNTDCSQLDISTLFNSTQMK